jgi:hypothetical protein
VTCGTAGRYRRMLEAADAFADHRAARISGFRLASAGIWC